MSQDVTERPKQASKTVNGQATSLKRLLPLAAIVILAATVFALSLIHI